MLRIRKLTDYGTVILAFLAANPREVHTAGEVAERTRLGVPTVSKLLKNLHRAGLVASTRGSHGGYELSRPAGEITAAAIVDAIEGPFALTEVSLAELAGLDRKSKTPQEAVIGLHPPGFRPPRGVRTPGG